jgi:hypothetical protein
MALITTPSTANPARSILAAWALMFLSFSPLTAGEAFEKRLK